MPRMIHPSPMPGVRDDGKRQQFKELHVWCHDRRHVKQCLRIERERFNFRYENICAPKHDTLGRRRSFKCVCVQPVPLVVVYKPKRILKMHHKTYKRAQAKLTHTRKMFSVRR